MSYGEDKITIREFSTANAARCESEYHDAADWNPLEWAGCAAGEVGEAANLCKKREAIGKEIADAVTYLDLLSTALGFNLDEILVAKFNEVSERIGYIEPGTENGNRLYARY
jgi:NTP pyrophosphatase (non-canonical NTP hydrolase)